MSRKKALLASSLAICSASAAWVTGINQHPVYAEKDGSLGATSPTDGTSAEEGVYQYLRPISAHVDGNLAAKVETKPLTYQVQKGDTLSRIGMFYGIDYKQLATYNHLTDVNNLAVGQVLNIPVARKWVRLKQGDTVGSLAAEYNMTAELLLQLNPWLQDPAIADMDPSTVHADQWIAVQQKLEPAKQEETAVGRTEVKEIRQADAALLVSERSAYGFQWPVDGHIVTSNFGWRGTREHKGIDISAFGQNVAIHAAKSGVVSAVKYDPAGYGYYVIIDHGNGWQTLYAHMRAGSIIVHVGEHVEIGQTIGIMGMTGNARGRHPHVHFEVRTNGKAINPMTVLK